MQSIKHHKPATVVRSEGRLFVTAAPEMAEGLRTYLRFHTINATALDPDGDQVLLRIDDNVSEDIVGPLVETWNQEVYGRQADSSPGQKGGRV